MTNKQIAYFKKTYELKNMQTVAEVLYVSRPAISYAISEIENEFGTELFIRTQSGVEPTPAGHLLYEHVINSEKQYKDLVSRMESMDPKKLVRQIRIGITPTNDQFAVPLIFDRYHSSFPEVQIEVREEKAEKIADMLDEGLLDIAIAPSNMEKHKDLCYFDLYEVRNVIALSDKNPLADKTIITVEDVLDTPFAFHSAMPEFIRTEIANMFAGFSRQPRIAAVLTEMDLIKYMVQNDFAATFLANDITAEWKGVISIPFIGFENSCTHKLIWSKNVVPSATTADFIEFVRNEFRHK